jgi:nucleoside-diphosphate-sugar epimerase
MRMLVLGGTLFLGRAVVSDALARGWDVTVFNRGRTGTPPAGTEELRGDRTEPDDLRVLAGRQWDAVVDTWDGFPRAVLDAARVLKDAADHYAYVSSRSVYRPPLPVGMREDSPLVAAEPDAVDGDYGQHKAGGELAAAEYFAERLLVARVGLVLGPHEDVGRLPWWLARMARGGDVLAPGPPELRLQYIDARDAAAWLVTAAAERLTGVFNVVSPPGHTTMRELLTSCLDATGGDATLHWTDPDTVLAAGITPWSQLPIWVPPAHPFRAMHETDSTRARAAGLRCRPIGDTVADTWQWMRTDGHTSRIARLDPEPEATILATAN